MCITNFKSSVSYQRQRTVFYISIAKGEYYTRASQRSVRTIIRINILRLCLSTSCKSSRPKGWDWHHHKSMFINKSVETLHLFTQECTYLAVFLAPKKNTCRKEQVREYYTEHGCRSRKPLKVAKCVGGCGFMCCHARKSKRRKVSSRQKYSFLKIIVTFRLHYALFG